MGAFRLLVMRKMLVGALTMLQPTACDMRFQRRGGWKSQWSIWLPVPRRQAKHSWIQTPSSSVMLWSIKISWTDFFTESKETIEALHDLHLDSCSQGAGGCWYTCEWWLGNHCVPGGYASHHPDTLGFPHTSTLMTYLVSCQRSLLASLGWGRTLWTSHTCHHCKVIRRHWVCCVKRLLTTLLVHQTWQRGLNQQLAFPWHHCLLLVER